MDGPPIAKFTQPGHCKSIEDFCRLLDDASLDLACDRELLGADGPLGRPLDVHGHTLTNRFAVHPMEGWDAGLDGLPSDLTRRRWRRFGRSGAKLIWGGEAFAVREDGRANPNQLFLNPGADTERGLTTLLEELRTGHAEVGEDPDELFVGLQLTHSGRWSRPTVDGPAPRIAYRHPVLDRRAGIVADSEVLSDDELLDIADCFVAAASLAARVGFQFVDVKCCHGYLLHELLGARARPGRFGGSLENRAALFRHIVAGIRAACPELRIAVRISVQDSVPFHADGATGVGTPDGWSSPWAHGFGIDSGDPRLPDLAEPIEFLRGCRTLGIELFNVTAGSPYYCPHLQRPAAYPPSDGYLPPEDPLRGVAAQLTATRACKAAVPGAVVVGTGYSYLQEFLPHVAQHEVRTGGVDVVGLGRMVLSYPELPLDVLRGTALDRKRICRTLSDCTTAPRNGIVSGCFPLDPFYKAGEFAAALRRAKRGRRPSP
jgi:2,4-dienoyl-CoA reductase-like NADH-dependent reductase (Old Yellow Enzyme family)